MTDRNTMPKSLFAEPRLVTNLEDCLFYHTVDIPGHGTVPGFWDIRGNESQYLGEVAFKNKRVIEIGPASGHLSFFMERQGAEVVSVDVAEDYHWDFFWDLHDPLPDELSDLLEFNRGNIERIKNSYWLCHRVFESAAKVHYGSGYSLPRELGTFDVSVLACVLLHNKNPLPIIENCARVTREQMVIVEPFRERQFSSAEFLPAGDRLWWDTWWGFAPKFFVDVLRSMGFTQSKVTFHTQQYFGKPEDLFTIVASRSAPREVDVSSVPTNVTISSPVERLRLETGEFFNLPVRVVNLGDMPISSFSTPAVLVSYHWRLSSGEVAVWDGLRTSLPRQMHNGDSENVLVGVRAPDEPGSYVLEVSMLEEGVTWYDDKLKELPLRIEAVVG